MKRKLFTIGYSGYAIDKFVFDLTANGVECLIDVREIPVSRKKGFSKSQLSTELAAAGIEYHHFRQLGSPLKDRHEVRETKDYNKFFASVRRHLAKPAPFGELRAAVEVAKNQTSCLMCCCSDWVFCHRSCVVDAINCLVYFNTEHLGQSEATVKKRRAA